ncbi:hypothetical protein BH09ACT10_BH09ACT10_16020 [soil metagenome]
MSDPKPDQLVDEIDEIRERLADTVDALVDRVSPKSIAKRTVKGVKAKFVSDDGSVRLETVVPIVVGVVAFVGLAVVGRRVFRD